MSNKKIEEFFKLNNEHDLVHSNESSHKEKKESYFSKLKQKKAAFLSNRNKKSYTVTLEEDLTLYQKIKKFIIKLFYDLLDAFNFESGIDILDDYQVFKRRNEVISNIIIANNIIFMLFITIGTESSNLILNLSFFLIMFTIRRFTKKLYLDDSKSILKQQMAMYISSFYIILASMVVYIKIAFNVGDSGLNPGVSFAFSDVVNFSITQAAYSLVYFAMVVVSLYQNSLLLKRVFLWVGIVMTIVHIAFLYPLYNYGNSPTELFNFFVNNGNVLVDILLRTLLLLVFMIALYSTSAISEMMNKKRKEELVKRRGMETEFKSVVTDVFDVISVFNKVNLYDTDKQTKCVGDMCKRLATVMGYSEKKVQELYQFTIIHSERSSELNLKEYENKTVLDEEDFKVIRDKTMIGSVIIKRLQLNQKSEDIVRVHFGKDGSDEFKSNMNKIQASKEHKLILLCEIYEILRSERSYKSKFKHNRAIDLLKLEFVDYFDNETLDRFIRYEEEFKKIFDEYNTSKKIW